MHNIHMLTIIDKSHYEEINQKPRVFNETKIKVERFGLREVVYKFNHLVVNIHIYYRI